MATVTIYIRKDVDKRGCHSVSFLLNHLGKNAYIPTGYKIPTELITAKGKITDKLIQHSLDEQLLDLQKKLIQYGYTIMNMDVKQIKERLMNKNFKERFHLDFIEWWEKNIKTMPSFSKNSSALNYLKRYTDGKLDIGEITIQWLHEYYAWLAQFYDLQSTYNVNVGCFAKAYNMCREELNREDKGGFIQMPVNPFESVKRPYLPKVSKKQEDGVNALTPEVVKRLLTLDVPEELQMAKDIFTLSFYFCGLNLKDLFDTCRTIQIDNDYYIEYVRSKTRSKTPTKMRLRIDPIIKPLVDKYKPYKGGDLTFNFSQMYSSYANFQLKIHNDLKRFAVILINQYAKEYNIEKSQASRSLGLGNFTLYVARRSWASIAYHQCKIPQDVVDRCLGHVLKSVAAVYYIKQDFAIIEEAKRKVIEYIASL
jgi:integrase